MGQKGKEKKGQLTSPLAPSILLIHECVAKPGKERRCHTAPTPTLTVAQLTNRERDETLPLGLKVKATTDIFTGGDKGDSVDQRLLIRRYS